MLTNNQSEQINHCLEFQNKLNIDTNGPNWITGINKYNKEINWLRCIHMEIAELIDSTPWKHWKNIETTSDINNIHVELVDVWHFLLSYLILRKDFKDLLKFVDLSYEPTNEFDYKKTVDLAEEVSIIALLTNKRGEAHFETMLIKFFQLCKLSGLSFEKLYKIYFAKNALNQFRQDNGYKEGTYIKVWNSKEDNVYMLQYADEGNFDNGDEIYEYTYKRLQENYQNQ